MVWLVRGYHVVCERERVGGLWGGRGCAEERGIRVHTRNPCDLPNPVDASRDHLHGGPSSPSRLCGQAAQVAAGSKQVGRGKMHLKDIWSVINPPGRASAAAAPAPRPTRSVDYWIRTPDWKRKMNDGSLT